MEYEVPYTAVTLMELLGLKSKESFRKNYLNPAIELQLIRMTVPDKPRSRNQRYVKRWMLLGKYECGCSSSTD